MYCVNLNACHASGGQFIGFDGNCYYNDDRQTKILIKSHEQAHSVEFTEASARNPAMADSIKMTTHKVHKTDVIVFDVFETPDAGIKDLYRDGTFSFTEENTAFVLFGERVTKQRFPRNNNNEVFPISDVKNMAQMDEMLVGLQGFKKIVVVLGVENIDIPGFLKALELYPILNLRALQKKCGDFVVTWDYRMHANCFLKWQESYVFSDLWRWINCNAVDFSPSTMDLFVLRDDFVKATEDISKKLTSAQETDLDDWTNRVCHAFQNKFKEITAERIDETTPDRTNLHKKMRDVLDRMTDLTVPVTWKKGLDNMIAVIMDQLKPQTCILVFGEPNDDCRFSVVSLWQAAQTLNQVHVMVYGHDRWKVGFDIFIFLAVPWIGYKLMPYLRSIIPTNEQKDSDPGDPATQPDSKITRRVVTRARGRSPAPKKTAPKSSESSKGASEKASTGTSTWRRLVNLSFN